MRHTEENMEQTDSTKYSYQLLTIFRVEPKVIYTIAQYQIKLNAKLHVLTALLLGKSHHYILERMMGDPQNQSRHGGEHRNLCHYQESNTDSSTTD